MGHRVFQRNISVFPKGIFSDFSYITHLSTAWYIQNFKVSKIAAGVDSASIWTLSS